MANLSRHLKLDSEKALRRANQKFIQRFQYIEEKLKESSKEFEDCSLAELDTYWEQAKK